VEQADQARSRGEDELAWGWLQKALAIYRAEGEHRGQATAGRRLAALQARRGDLRSALQQAEAAHKAAEQAWDRPEMAAAQYVLGAVNCQLGEVEAGLRWLHRSVDAWGELGRIDGQVRAWRRIAHAQSVDGDLDAGLAAWGRCLAVCRHTRDLAGEADIHAEAARACANAGRPDLAITHGLAALGRHRHLRSARLGSDLSLMVDIRGQLGGTAFQELLRSHLDLDAAALVTQLVDEEDSRLHPPPPPPPDPTGDLSDAEAELLIDLGIDPTAARGDAPEDDAGFWSPDPTLTDAPPVQDHGPLELVTVFARVIVGLVALLLILLLTASVRAALSG